MPHQSARPNADSLISIGTQSGARQCKKATVIRDVLQLWPADRAIAFGRGVPILPAFQTEDGQYTMRYLHTMVRVSDIDQSLHFYRDLLGLKEVRRMENEKGRYTLIFLAPPGQEETPIELTYNWDPETYAGGRNFGHLAYEVDDIYAFCDRLQKAGVTINRPPRDGNMAFIRSPDNISIEILQKGNPLPPQEPWQSMQNTGQW
jgi:lactoylglutathione lyase